MKQGTAPRARCAPPSGTSPLDGFEFGPARAVHGAKYRAAACRVQGSIIMSRKSRYAILASAIVIIVCGVIYAATRGGGQREQGLVGPKGPPPK